MSYTKCMTFHTTESKIKTIKQGNRNFMIADGLVVSPRAGIEISHRCPENYQDLIQECIRHGWLKPVAYMTEREMMISGLLNNE